jgi:hypothetical protein
MSREQPPRRFIAIPFSSGCRSHSSVDVVDTARHAGKKPHPQGTCVPIDKNMRSFDS